VNTADTGRRHAAVRSLEHEIGTLLRRIRKGLAELFALDKGSVSRVVHQLLELGLIARSPDPADGRASLLSVTDEAVRRLAEVRDHRREHFDDRLLDWEPAEIEELAARLGRFNHALSDVVPSGA
jgi:DNA-binding MarR family transcriptional regulator